MRPHMKDWFLKREAETVSKIYVNFYLAHGITSQNTLQCAARVLWQLRKLLKLKWRYSVEAQQ